MHGALPKIWIITDPEREANPIAPVRRALTECPGRAVGVQLRAKAHPDRQVLAWARELRALTRSTDSLLLVNGRADLAVHSLKDVPAEMASHSTDSEPNGPSSGFSACHGTIVPACGKRQRAARISRF